MVQLDLKKSSILKKIYSLHNGNFVSGGLQRTNRKVGKIATTYHQVLFKKRPSLDIFCANSVN